MLTSILGRTSVRLAALAATVPTGLLGGTLAYADQPADPPPSGGVAPQIIGGGEASEPYPFMATLVFVDANGNDTGHQCGATEIFRGWLTTAAHCVEDPPAPESLSAEQHAELIARFGPHVFDWKPSTGHFYVRVGNPDRTQGEVADVTQVVTHPDFDWFANTPAVKAADLSMLQLDHTLGTQPIQLAGEPAKPHEQIRLLGWGITEPDTTGPDPVMLQELDTTVAPDADCRVGTEGDITDGEICTENPYDTDGPCYGDSGSPAIKKGADGRWKWIGITSRGGRWCGTMPAIYTDPTYYRKWIYDTARGVVVDEPVAAGAKAGPTYTLPYEPPNP